MLSDNLHEINEECGVFGIWEPERCDVARLSYYGLFALQHRGQESAGICVNDEGLFHFHKGLGLVHDVFDKSTLETLGEGNMAIGHVRYSTSGGSNAVNAQPVVVRHIKGSMALAHNGNLVNSFELRQKLENEGCIFQTTTDTEAISYIITKERLKSHSIEEALEKTMDIIQGSYSLVVMSPSKLIAARDSRGMRPLCIGKTPTGGFVFASESCALDAVGATFVRDIIPGEIVVVDMNGMRSIRTHVGKCDPALCVFEYIYFARNDSVIEGASVHEARLRAGEFLAKEHPVDADVVIGVPDSGLDAALGFSRASGIPFELGLVKNRYIGRTFIAPGQAQRENLVRIKLNPIESAIRGKKVVLIDDSIVRGTTSERIVKTVRDAGAKEVHMRISAPPFLNPCYYGTDIDSKENLIACKHTVPEIADIIGADTLGYLSVDAAKEIAVRVAGNYDYPLKYCAACFDGKYPTDVPAEGSKDRFEQKIPKEWKEKHFTNAKGNAK